MTNDLTAIRAQMEALEGFTPGRWEADLGETYRVKADGMNIATANFVTLLDRIPTDQVRQNARLIAAAPDMRETILTLCADVERLSRMVERTARYLPDGIVRCYGDKCREPWCASCFGEEDAEEFMVKVEADRSAIRAALSQEGDA